MAHVFISYAHKDHDYARKLADDLLANGFDVWIDDRIDFGSRWVQSIFEALDGCSAFILVMTAHSNESEFVEKEYLRAADQKKPSFPLLLEGRAFPYFVGIQYYDVQDGKLPGQDFLDRLAKFAPRTGESGQDVAATPQQQAKLEHETAEIAKAETPDPAVPVEQAIIPKRPQRRSRGWFVFAAAILIVAAIVVILVVSRNLSILGGASVTATSMILGGEHGQIAFQSDRDGNNEIYVMDSDGSNPRNLSNNPASDTEPAWSPDGTHLAFTSDRTGADSSSIYLMDANGGNVQALMPDSEGWNPAWSPDGKQIAFAAFKTNSAEIFVVGTDGNNPRALTDNSVTDGSPAWSPDGKQIAFMSQTDGNDDIYVMDADGGNIRRLTNSPGDDDFPKWSPDGTRIAFQSKQGNDPQICIMAVDGSSVQCITSDLNDGYEPGWSPDGTQIVFTTYRDGNNGREIYRMDADGSRTLRLTNNPAEDRFPVWQP